MINPMDPFLLVPFSSALEKNLKKEYENDTHNYADSSNSHNVIPSHNGDMAKLRLNRKNFNGVFSVLIIPIKCLCGKFHEFFSFICPTTHNLPGFKARYFNL